MLASLLKRLSARPEDDALLPADEQHIAVAALLVAAAQADHRYDAAEKDIIERALAARYALTAPAAAQLRADGEAAEQAATDVYRFTSLIKKGVPHEERAAVLEALWRVVLSDGVREAHEDVIMRRITELLGLDMRDSVLARQRVQAAR